ncbi:tRNA nucleotidyltransferase/poly(A) polymerase, RNA and SrmB- binding domain,Poly A polymerase, head [Cinara cedri]|uniref:tRNA nucleotidyltransferase/poly(A) polymerase, RNA and SrmB- binding domain,Poly A polymerase, head n=1 Tax=Cinara cedri TaxID=506608 RepID=A0A5E4NRJ3_9HEMI|nr:tRNA nucleotidyltransferase/poly(A) polymerase, RNA and SrmB- binding domain,Poly A polymerase, head [Cinara cedri]
MLVDNETNLIINAIEEFGGEARFVGGCVRDSILKRNVHDIDLATNLLPGQTIKALELYGIKTIPTGLKHGTITAVLNQKSFEITTLRYDVKSDGRHAEVEFTDDWQADASRRDFTFNALYADRHGHIYDYFCGIKDLEARRLNFIGNAEDRIKEDYLRILRAFRFHAKICVGELSNAILEVCKKHSHMIQSLSGERIRDEIFKLLECDNPFPTLESMQKFDILYEIIPQKVNCCILSSELLTNTDALVKLALLLRTTRPLSKSIYGKKFLGEVQASIAEYVDVFEERSSASITKLPSEIEFRKRSTEDDNLGEYISKFLRLSKKQERRLLFLLTNNISTELSEKEQKKYISLYGRELYRDLVRICGVESAKNINTTKRYIAFACTFTTPKFPLSGYDLISLGYQPGKSLGENLGLIKKHWEDSSYALTKDELMLYAKNFISVHR